MAKTPSDVVVKLNEVAPEPTEVIADAIIKASAGFDKLLKSGLTRKTIAILIKDATTVPMGQTLRILECLPRLAELYVTPEKRRQVRKK